MIQLLASVKWDKYSFNLECFSAKNITSLYLPRIVLHFLKRSTTLIYPIEKNHSFHCVSFWLENDMSSSNLSVKKYNVLLTFSHNVAGRQQKCVTQEVCVGASNNKNPLCRAIIMNMVFLITRGFILRRYNGTYMQARGH